AAQVGVVHEHPLEDVLVTDRGPHELAAGGSHGRLETAVGKHGYDHAPVAQRGPPQPIEGDQADQLVAIDDQAVAVHDDEPVGVAVEGEAQVGTPGNDLPGQRCRGRRSAVHVDVH